MQNLDRVAMPSSRVPRRAARLARVVRPPASSCCSARARASSESNFDAAPKTRSPSAPVRRFKTAMLIDKPSWQHRDGLQTWATGERQTT